MCYYGCRSRLHYSNFALAHRGCGRHMSGTTSASSSRRRWMQLCSCLHATSPIANCLTKCVAIQDRSRFQTVLMMAYMRLSAMQTIHKLSSADHPASCHVATERFCRRESHASDHGQCLQAIDVLDEAGSRARIAAYLGRGAADSSGRPGGAGPWAELQDVLAAKAEAAQVLHLRLHPF